MDTDEIANFIQEQVDAIASEWADEDYDPADPDCDDSSEADELWFGAKGRHDLLRKLADRAGVSGRIRWLPLLPAEDA